MIKYRIENPRPPRCALCGQIVIGRVARVLAHAIWYEGPVTEQTKREVYAGDRVHEKHLPKDLREEETI